ncbi:MAG: type II toxin-antitoxin system HicA family toxin, partial [Planctomycetes bacterium]|nr:type II toxin-antitoxin system HicA family toxin [Planctomycetota bacterium]
TGSHHIYVKDGRDERLVIPVHANQTLKIGLQRHLMKIIPVSTEEL